MFQILIKKNFLVDYLGNFVDIHNHILPGLDDGAKDISDSLAIIKGFNEIGITHIITTPHVNQNFYPNTTESIRTAYNLVQDELLHLGLKHIALESSSEYMIDSNFENLLEQKLIAPIRNKFLLVEMPFLQIPINFDQATFTIATKGYNPILAHPERYFFLHSNYNKYGEFKSKGISLQLNLLSLGNYYGKQVSKIAKKLLMDDYIDFAGTDIHNVNQLKFLKDIKLCNRTLNKLIPILNRNVETFY
ncbi:tyrosine-protein phosphatase [Arenibacter troitsensis]|uniref:protein-tyrosine-phosphatase n=1 Tax=Arenibacter troitsensis TaxID=188872 RepID=A0A1X7IZX1_9FLAO|nr:CpsB/CapC family capsule biosynthesis tyrosine phosphatase [Arenibacter troitsensis]SMG20044.1 Tyrosine-protein phosphatase YwqE [Arenibacter troitsensis]